MDIEKGHLSQNLAIIPLAYKSSKGDTTISTSNLVSTNASSTSNISSDENHLGCKPEAKNRNGKTNLVSFVVGKYWDNII